MKSSGLIFIFHKFSAKQKKLWNLIWLNAIKTNKIDKQHSLSLDVLRPLLGKELTEKDIAREIANLQVKINYFLVNDKTTWRWLNLLTFVEVEDNLCNYKFNEHLSEILKNPEFYSKINSLTKISHSDKKNISSTKYIHILYKLCMQYSSVGETPWMTTQEIRSLLEVTDNLHEGFGSLNRIIRRTIKELNARSDLSLKIEYKIIGRKITHLKFLIKFL